jgi:nucleoside-diphosphate-sugar epimerase
MADLATTIPRGSWVLVTGANEFVASHIAREFLQRGYKLRGTVRDLEKSSWLVQDVFKSYADNGDFELVFVPNLAARDAFDDAVKGMSAIVHVASITTFSPDPNVVISQTVVGATMYVTGNSTHVERDTWNKEALKLVWAPPPYDPPRGMFVYNASKTEAEMAVWKFVAEKPPHFSVNCIDPATIIGEPLNKKHLETPYSYLKVLYDGNMDFLGAIPSSKSPYHNSTIRRLK